MGGGKFKDDLTFLAKSFHCTVSGILGIFNVAPGEEVCYVVLHHPHIIYSIIQHFSKNSLVSLLSTKYPISFRMYIISKLCAMYS